MGTGACLIYHQRGKEELGSVKICFQKLPFPALAPYRKYQAENEKGLDPCPEQGERLTTAHGAPS
jgi:hypothetical protein